MNYFDYPFKIVNKKIEISIKVNLCEKKNIYY